MELGQRRPDVPAYSFRDLEMMVERENLPRASIDSAPDFWAEVAAVVAIVLAVVLAMLIGG